MEFSSPESFEDSILKRAVRFRVVRYTNASSQERLEVTDYAEAVRIVWPIWKAGGRATIYAFTELGDYCLLPKERTNHFGKLWVDRIKAEGQQ